MSVNKTGSIRNYLEPQLAAAAGRRLSGAARKSFQTLLKSLARGGDAAAAAKTASQGLTIEDYLAKRVVMGRAGSARDDFSAEKPSGEVQPAEGHAAASAAARADSGGEPRLRGRRMPRSAQIPGGADETIERCIRQAAAKYNLPPELIRSVIRAESGFNARAVSSAGARGLMQLMPETAAELGVTDSFDVRQNIDGGARYLRQMLDRFGGRLETALAAYNAGPGAVEKFDGQVPYTETRDYVRRVLRFAGEKKAPVSG
jgi:soluble lytic murein transglycosylase-like protein